MAKACHEKILLLKFTWIVTTSMSSLVLGYFTNKTDEQRLSEDLLRNYNPNLRPVLNRNDTLRLDFQLYLYQILEASEREQFLKLYLWIDEFLIDELLGWDPAKYDFVRNLTFPSAGNLWKSDVYLYNSVDLDPHTTMHTSSVLNTIWINKTNHFSRTQGFWGAQVRNWYPMVAKLTCKFNTLYFPFDTQRCHLFFGSWSYTVSKIDIWPGSAKVITDDFSGNEEWELIDFNQHRQLFEYPCCPEPYAVLIGEMVIRRKPLYYIVNLVLPIVIITEISFIGFFTPSSGCGERTEKVSLGMQTLLAMAIMLLMVGNLMPATSDYVPFIGWFFIAGMTMIAIAVVITCFIMEVHRKRRSKKKGGRNGGSTRINLGAKLAEHMLDGKDDIALPLIPNNPNNNNPTEEPTPVEGAEGTKGKRYMVSQSLSETLTEISQWLEEQEFRRGMEWEVLAEVLDRVFLIIFTTLLAMITTAMMLCGKYFG